MCGFFVFKANGGGFRFEFWGFAGKICKPLRKQKCFHAALSFQASTCLNEWVLKETVRSRVRAEMKVTGKITPKKGFFKTGVSKGVYRKTRFFRFAKTGTRP